MITIKKLFLLIILFFLLGSAVTAQEIVNIILVGKDGITENIKKAKSFILVKKYPENIFERLDYQMGAPLVKLRTYNDSNLTNLEGAYLEYHPNGNLHIKGQYSQNLQSTEWYQFDDTGKHIFTEVYDKGKLINSYPPKVEKKDTVINKDDREANVNGGGKSWLNYIVKNLNADVAQQSRKGGQVRVLFTVNKEGDVVSIYLKKSVEFVLDEEALRVIRNSPKWIPAFQNGKTVNAYRVQPVTFIRE